MTYRVAQFARLGGVTVRTLQYYDRIDLLKPSYVTDAGHRLYEQHDLIRLQQIVTLKWMGFSLSHIKTILDNPAYDLHDSLVIQKQAVDEKIRDLQAASEALARALDALDHTEDPALDTLSTIIRGVSSGDHDTWVREYYNEEAWRGIVTRRFAYTPEQMRQFQQDWADLYEAFEAHLNDEPDNEAVQALAARMDELIGLFTGGDEKTEAGLARFNTDVWAGNVPEGYEGPTAYDNRDPDFIAFTQRALTIYREKHKK